MLNTIQLIKRIPMVVAIIFSVWLGFNTISRIEIAERPKKKTGVNMPKSASTKCNFPISIVPKTLNILGIINTPVKS